MKLLNWFNLTVMLGAILFTWNALADTSVRVHMIHNLNSNELSHVESALSRMGYEISKKAMFSESKNTIIVTKILPTEREPAALSLEMVRLDAGQKLPRTVFEYKTEGNDLNTAIDALPRPSTLSVYEVITPAMASIHSVPQELAP